MSGNLIVRPLSAKLTHGTELFGKMDPLVKVIVGSHVQRTPAMRRGHKNPTWDTELSLRRTSEDFIRFEVWDKDIISKNDLIGSGDLPFSRIFQQGGVFKDWVPLLYKNKSAGDLLVSVEFIPDYGVNMQNLTSGQADQPLVQSNYMQQNVGQMPPTTQDTQPGPTQFQQPSQTTVLPLVVPTSSNYMSQQPYTQNQPTTLPTQSTKTIPTGFSQTGTQSYSQTTPVPVSGTRGEGQTYGNQPYTQNVQVPTTRDEVGQVQPGNQYTQTASKGEGQWSQKYSQPSPYTKTDQVPSYGNQQWSQPYSQSTRREDVQPGSQWTPLYTESPTRPSPREDVGQRTNPSYMQSTPIPVTTKEGMGQGSLPTTGQRVPEQLSDIERKREMEEGYVPTQQSYPGYSAGIIGYSPVIGQPSYIKNEGNYSPNRYPTGSQTRYDYDRVHNQPTQTQPTQTQLTQTQPTQIQPTQYQQPMTTPYQRTTVPPGIQEDLVNIINRISGTKQIQKENFDNRFSTRPTSGGFVPSQNVGTVNPNLGRSGNVMSYQQQPVNPQMGTYEQYYDQRVMQDKNPSQNFPSQSAVVSDSKNETLKGYLPTQGNVGTQLPGVISNPESRQEEMGKFVVHQGGTHSQVGSVQSHRIISRAADNPGLTSANLDEEARIALGDVPQTYYGENK